MHNDDHNAFCEGLAGVYAFYGKQVSTFAVDVWWQALKLFGLQAVTDAFNRHLVNPDSGQFLPKPADIVRMLQGTTQDSAMIAWAKIDKAIRHVGPWRDVVFDDAFIHRVIHDMGGWTSLGTKSEKEWPFVAREFENRYRGYKMRNEIPEYPPILIGSANAHNEKEGFSVQLPTLIGNAEIAINIMRNGSRAPMLNIQKMDASIALPMITHHQRAAA